MIRQGKELGMEIKREEIFQALNQLRKGLLRIILVIVTCSFIILPFSKELLRFLRDTSLKIDLVAFAIPEAFLSLLKLTLYASLFVSVPVVFYHIWKAFAPLFRSKGMTSGSTVLITAIFLSEYAPEWLRGIIKPVLEVLAGIPTVVLGFFALTFLSPTIVQALFPSAKIFSAASAAIAVGIMIIPLVSSLSEDAMSAVPHSLREGAHALGATKFEVSLRVVVPAALSGITASFILAVSRAIGETMIVALAAGGTPNLTWNPLEGVQTMTAYIVQVSLGDTPQGSLEFRTIFAVGMALFLMTLAMNVASQYLLHRFREVYE